ncbi:MAG TPA: thiamine phosphate synthase [Gemmatimonadota bacterium]|nr:thiamine phosphate synthase [Gemmatimonadota bacterium]
MAIDRNSPILCFVHSVSELDAGFALIETGAESWGSLDIVQVRGKDLPAGDMERLVERWVEAVAEHPTLVVVNDRLDVTLATGADGVHVGRDDLPPERIREEAPKELVVGVSTHDRQELLLAQGAGATYVGLGAFYPSRTKPEARVLDPWKAGLMETIPALTIPVVAIGGITEERLPEVLAMPPVTGIAISGAVQGAEDPAAAVRGLRSALDGAWMERPEHVH